MFSWLDLYSTKSPPRVFIVIIKGMSFIKVGVGGSEVILSGCLIQLEQLNFQHLLDTRLRFS